VIVTVSREYGAAGLAVADGVAHALGYELLLDDLPKTVAARLGTSPAEVAERAAADESLAERILGRLGAGTAEVISLSEPRLPGDFDESVRREIERTIRDRAVAGNVVILGRNAAALLGPRPDLVRVFLTGEREWRLSRIMESFGNTRAEALADLERIDAARRKTAKERYKAAWGDARFYDILLDASRFGVDGTIELVVAAVRVAERART
jgi:cytidylate kinase